ncbi:MULTISPECIES: carboxypeptidase-like regulatory domain-containing protein [unclassified Pseudoalteromonas]|uniref:carboxypeptidase-like regulatory domain-containing protein n=1 Tax=unclassified Pseudoalteromonas TaxID=194690 RepID=UPI002175C873|nr:MULTISPECIES: carboxypeptidase-like regulatory domain-containing protein [unclassified Pseudoalteromonas]
MFSWSRKKKEVFLGPEVNGIVTENGAPIANLEIIRSLIYIDEKVRRDIATTDEDGRFHFPKKTILSSIPNKLIVKHRVSQEVFIESESTLIPFWVVNQSSIIEIPEYSQKLAFLSCELTNKRVDFEFKKIITNI